MAVDIFEALDAMFRKQKLTEHPTPFILHRFLASDKDFAQVAKQVQLECTDAEMVFEIWRTAVPRMNKPPRFTYVGPRKQKAAESLVAALMLREHLRKEEAEDVAELAEMVKGTKKLEAYYGVE